MISCPRRLLLPTTVLALGLGGCASWLPDANRLNVQQGNLVAEPAIASLQPGQTRERVRELIGEPILTKGFRPDRWDYVYYKTEAGLEPSVQRLTLFFGDEGLERIVDRYSQPEDPLPDVPEGRLPEEQRPAAPAGSSGPGGGSRVPGPR